jgi:hypothetical protein
MNRLKTSVCATFTVYILTAGIAFAHHGWTGYDESKTLTLSGTIQESTYGNPHGTLELKVSGDKPKTWKAILAPPSRMGDRGLSSDMLKKGTTATLVGYPHKEHDTEMRAERITVGGKTVELR